MLVVFLAMRTCTGLGCAATAPVADGRRQQGKNDDHENYVMDALANVGDGATEQIAAQDHCSDPQDAAKNVVSQISGIGHGSCAGYRRAEGAHDGHKACQDHGFAAMLFVKIVGPLQMAAAEKERFLAGVQGGARGTANPVADLIADDGAEHYREEQPLQGNQACGGKYACSDQQGVTGQEKTDEEAGFDEDDDTDNQRSTGAGTTN